MKRIIKSIVFLGISIFVIILLALSVRGIKGNPDEKVLNNKEWSDSGPFELSPERARFALTYSMVENKSVQLSNKLAIFSVPDLGYLNGKYVSLFQPGVSIFIIPGYLLGKYLGYSQLGSYFQISLFALFNFFLVFLISKKITGKIYISLIAGIVFLFASPSYAYAVSLFQHHISTFVLLVCIYLVLFSKSIISNILFWIFYGISIIIDFPNAFMLLPLALYQVGHIFSLNIDNNNLKISINTKFLLAAFSVIIPAFMFFGFNYLSYGNPLTLSGSVTQIKQLDKEGNPKPPEIIINKDVSGFFDMSYLPRGLYAHLLSVDRGLLVFTPVMLIGVLGLIEIRKKNKNTAYLLASVILVDIILYSSFGIGGWAFGSRYLIPSYALFSIAIAYFLKENKNKLLFLTFYLSLTYSVLVNTAGALSSNKNPPKMEAIGLQLVSGRTELYSFDRNIQYILDDKSKSFVFQSYASKFLKAWEYYLLIVMTIYILVIFLSVLEILERKSLHK